MRVGGSVDQGHEEIGMGAADGERMLQQEVGWWGGSWCGGGTDPSGSNGAEGVPLAGGRDGDVMRPCGQGRFHPLGFFQEFCNGSAGNKISRGGWCSLSSSPYEDE